MSFASRTNTSGNAEEFVLLVGTSSEFSAAGIDMGKVKAVPCTLPSPSPSPSPSPDDAASMGTDSSPM